MRLMNTATFSTAIIASRPLTNSGLRTSRRSSNRACSNGRKPPGRKGHTSIADEVALGDRDNMVFGGTAVSYGHGAAIVTVG